MFVPIRDAISPHPDRDFARRVALVLGVTTTLVLGAGVVCLRRGMAEGFKPAAIAPTMPAVTIPSIDIALVPAVKRELAAYAFEAYPHWVVANPARECPQHLLEVNAFDPELHAVDPWGTPYQFLCGKQWNIRGLETRSAGPDRQFDTADDLSSHR